LVDEGSAEGFRIIADARQYLLDLGRQTPVGAEGLDREEIDRLLLREKRRAKKARQKARAFEGIGGVLEMVDGQEVLRIGDQLYYPEATDGSEPSATSAEGEELNDGAEEPSVPRPVTSDRFVGSHVIAPVSSCFSLKTLQERDPHKCSWIVSSRWRVSLIGDERHVSLLPTITDATIRSKNQTQEGWRI